MTRDPAEALREPVRCACHSDDAYRCWSLRYEGHSAMSVLEIQADGGPCECVCHEHDEDDPS